MRERQEELVIAFLGALCFTVMAVFCMSLIPDKLNEEWIVSTIVHPLNYFVAENSEKMQFIFGAITFPVTYFLCIYWIKSDKIKISKSNCVILKNSFCLVLFTIMGYVFLKEKVYMDNFPLILQKVYWIILIVILASYIFWGGARNTWLPKVNYFVSKINESSVIKKLLLIVGGLSIVLICSFYYRETYYYGHGYVEGHVDAYFYPIWKVACGQFPLVDFTSLYGFYPYFYVALMSIMGGVTMENFCLIVLILVAIIFFALFYILWSICKNKVYALLGLCSIEYILRVYHLTFPGSGDFYLQYLPHRMLMPCLMLAIACLYIKTYRKGFKITGMVEMLGWLLGILALLWNIDTGIVVWLGWGLYLIFLYLLKHTLIRKETILFIFKIICKLFVALAMSIVILVTVTYLCSGQVIELKQIFWGQNIFYASGFLMVKLCLWHPWIVVMLFYAISLAIAIPKLKDLRNENHIENLLKTSMYFMIAIVGVGIFLYYQGRSHNAVFIPIVWPAIIIITSLVDDFANSKYELRQEVMSTRILYCTWNSIIVALLLTMTIGLGYAMLSPQQLFALKEREIYTSSAVSKVTNVIEDADLDITNLDLLVECAAAIYEFYDVKYMPNVQAVIDVFSYDDVAKIQSYLSATTNDVILDVKTQGYLCQYNEKQFNDILIKYYEIEEIDSYLVCRRK